MVADSAPLNGSGPQMVWIEHKRVGQDAAGNFTRFYVEVRYYGVGYGSWGSGPFYWSADAPGFHVEGSWSIPQAARNDYYTVLWSGYYDRAHDSAGNLGPFNAQASIDASRHSAIGAGTVVVTEPASPRIPKRPGAPGFSIDQVDSDSFRVVVTAPADNGGSAIDKYLIRVSSNPRADTPGSYEDFPRSGTSVITGRKPGTRYYVTVYAHNGSADNNGYSTYQASKAVDTSAGIYVSDGTRWVAQGVNASSGTAWQNLTPKLSDGSAWIDPYELLPAPEIDDIDRDSPTQVRVFLNIPSPGASPEVAIQYSTSPDFTAPVEQWFPVGASASTYIATVTGISLPLPLYFRARRNGPSESTTSQWSNTLKITS